MHVCLLVGTIVAMTTGSIAGRLTCLTGHGMPDPTDCRRIITCGTHEDCGGVSISDGSATVICSDCCNSDLCAASLCSAKGYPTQRGPICYHCDYPVDDPAHCDQIKVCNRNQVCSVSELPLSVSGKKYSVRCLDTAPCQAVLQTGICASCCSGQLCNTNCSAAVCQDDASCQQLMATFRSANLDICLEPTMKYLCNRTCGLCGGVTSAVPSPSTVTTSSISTTVTSAAHGACAQSPCRHGACTNTGSWYKCTCDPGYLGVTCSTTDPCAYHPCGHGNCNSSITGGFRCVCYPGYTGAFCSNTTKVASPCASSPCIHGACRGGGGGHYSCMCDPGYTDINCFTNIDDCRSTPCIHGQCLDGVNTYTCACYPGYTGLNCDKDIDDCSPNPCHHGHCTDITNGYRCNCHPGFTGMDCDTKIPIRDCKDILDRGMTSPDNVFTVTMAASTVLVKCDMTTDGGGWTVLLHRTTASVDFDHRDSTDYAVGFGDIKGNYWIGLEAMHSLTSDGRRYQLRIDVSNATGHQFYEVYDDFSVGPSRDFRLQVGANRGNAGDSLSNHTGYGFTTRDRDVDTDTGVNCAAYLHGGWWFHHCYDSCLTCLYVTPGSTTCEAMSWNTLGYCTALSKAVMMVRCPNSIKFTM